MKKLLLIVLPIYLMMAGCSKPEPDVTDIDGNSYKTIRIGKQVWMAENLKVTRYRNGDAIATGRSHEKKFPGSEWSNSGKRHDGYFISTEPGAYDVYDGNESNADTYGYLYNWWAANDSRNIAPEGWRVPSMYDFHILIKYIGRAGGKIKEAGTEHWNSPNSGATNESGFTALPGGKKGDFDYSGMGESAYFWSGQEDFMPKVRRLYPGKKGYYLTVKFNTSSVEMREGYKSMGYSIRCIKED